MKKKDLPDLKNTTIAELEKTVFELQLQINKSQMEMKMRKNKNVNLVKNLKKDLARTLTSKKEKELANI